VPASSKTRLEAKSSLPPSEEANAHWPSRAVVGAEGPGAQDVLKTKIEIMRLFIQKCFIFFKILIIGNLLPNITT